MHAVDYSAVALNLRSLYNRDMYDSPVDGTNARSLAFLFDYLRGTASSIRRVGEALFVQKGYLACGRLDHMVCALLLTHIFEYLAA